MTSRKPAVLIACGLILGLTGGAAVLLHLYSQASARHFDPALPALPSATQLLATTRQFDPSLASIDLQLIHEPRPLPRSGLLQLYRVSDNGRPVYALALVRHDIACGTCRDLLAAVFLTASTREIGRGGPLGSLGEGERLLRTGRVPGATERDLSGRFVAAGTKPGRHQRGDADRRRHAEGAAGAAFLVRIETAKWEQGKWLILPG